MKNILNLLFALFSLLTITSCSKTLLGKEIVNTPVTNFEILWQDFDQHYGAFAAKNIDWKAEYAKLRPTVNNEMTERELYAALTRLLDILNDNHIYLRPLKATGLPWYNGGILGKTTVQDYDRAVAQKYLAQKQVYNNSIEYGTFSGNIGYINLLNFDNNISTYHKAMDDVLTHLKDTKGIVIELRENRGGEDRVAQYIANRFASEKNLSFTAAVKNGPGYNDFAKPLSFFTEPQGDFQYNKPVVMLTNLNTYSSGETFVLGMLQNKNVRMVGGVTGGALSDAVTRDLPNGWSYRLPIADVRDAAGRNLEGIGIQPHVEVKNTQEELQIGKDKALEKALELLN